VGSVEHGEHKVPAMKKLPPQTAQADGGYGDRYPDGVSPDDFDQSVPADGRESF